MYIFIENIYKYSWLIDPIMYQNYIQGRWSASYFAASHFPPIFRSFQSASVLQNMHSWLCLKMCRREIMLQFDVVTRWSKHLVLFTKHQHIPQVGAVLCWNHLSTCMQRWGDTHTHTRCAKYLWGRWNLTRHVIWRFLPEEYSLFHQSVASSLCSISLFLCRSSLPPFASVLAEADALTC